jgi:hypothetical protein
MKQIIEGSLEIVEVLNGYTLYGQYMDGCPAFLAHVGDGVDSIMSDPEYDPNDDPDLPEAYGFELV